MHFVVITHVLHKYHEGRYYAYGPYMREMNLWFRHVDKVTVVAPLVYIPPDAIDLPYVHERIRFVRVPAISFTTLSNALRALWNLPGILFRIWYTMRRADHIHLRCPGNMGLLGSLVQIAFPGKKKTVKYAGEWPDYENEPLSYRVQKRIAKCEQLSKKTKVLIYGDWNDFTKNCIPFFTASYTNLDAQIKADIRKIYRSTSLRIVFVGTLDERKRPDYTIETVSTLRQIGYDVRADIIGEGPFRAICEEKINQLKLSNYVSMHGNLSVHSVAKFYRDAHFLVFLTRMEGWPKVVAEAMFWGCVPVTTDVSCVSWMLGYGERGIIVERNPESAAAAIEKLIENPGKYIQLAENAKRWSRLYTLDRFEQEIRKLLQPEP